MGVLRELIPIIARTHPAFSGRPTRPRSSDGARNRSGTTATIRGGAGGVIAVAPDEMGTAARGMRKSAAELDRIASELREAVAATSGWKGTAAQQFADAWAAYQIASEQHRRKLDELQGVLARAANAFSAADPATERSIDRAPGA